MRTALIALLLGLLGLPASAQRANSFAPEVRELIKVDAPVIALTHVKLIDGTGAPERADQTLVINLEFSCGCPSIERARLGGIGNSLPAIPYTWIPSLPNEFWFRCIDVCNIS